MSARVRWTALGLGIAILVIGCRGRRQSAREEAAAPAAMNPSARVRADVPIPFSPVPGEPAPAQPCGPKRRGPCLLLGWEHYNFAWGYAHSAWFMDTDGREFQYDSRGQDLPLGGGPQADPVRSALIDQLVSDDDFARIVAASKALPRRVTAAEVTHALSLLTSSLEGNLEPVRDGVCYDGGGSAITGYLFTPAGKGSSPQVLEEQQCSIISKANPSRAARELAQWVHKLWTP
jgi:hypothetical protein